MPLLAPQNFTLVDVTSSTEAIFSWLPVPIDSVRGHFRGYKVSRDFRSLVWEKLLNLSIIYSRYKRGRIRKEKVACERLT